MVHGNMDFWIFSLPETMLDSMFFCYKKDNMSYFFFFTTTPPTSKKSTRLDSQEECGADLSKEESVGVGDTQLLGEWASGNLLDSFERTQDVVFFGGGQVKGVSSVCWLKNLEHSGKFIIMNTHYNY